MNMNLTREELDKLVKSNDLEQYSQEQFRSFIEANEEVLIKGEKGELDEIEKSEYDTLIAEINSFAKVDVYDRSPESQNRLVKSVAFIRPKQVEWDEIEKGEDGEELEKAKSGTYTDTSLNRKLGRVGQKYGSKKQSTDDGDGAGKSSKGVTKDNIKGTSLSSNTSGGYTLNVKMKNGDIKHFNLSREETASLKNSPLQKQGIEKNKGMFDMAVEKMGSDKPKVGKKTNKTIHIGGKTFRFAEAKDGSMAFGDGEGTVYYSKPEESQGGFIRRVTEEINKDFKHLKNK